MTLSPGTRRSGTTALALALIPLVWFPVFAAGRSLSLTTLAFVVLCAATWWLFSRRAIYRTAFLVPASSFLGLFLAYVESHGGSDAASAGIALAWMGCLIGAIVIHAFWRPYEDDLEELNYKNDQPR